MIWAKFNMPILQDGDLPKIIQKGRESRGDLTGKGFIGFSEEDILGLFQALLSPQYKRFMIHLLLAWKDPDDIHPISGDTKGAVCAICGKPLWEHGLWSREICSQVPRESQEMEYLEWGSKKSSVSLCLDCIAQLKYLQELLKIADPALVTPFWIKTLSR